MVLTVNRSIRGLPEVVAGSKKQAMIHVVSVSRWQSCTSKEQHDMRRTVQVQVRILSLSIPNLFIFHKPPRFPTDDPDHLWEIF